MSSSELRQKIELMMSGPACGAGAGRAGHITSLTMSPQLPSNNSPPLLAGCPWPIAAHLKYWD